jgi:hypothetical protein
VKNSGHKFSLRGSLAGDIARQLLPSADEADLVSTLESIFRTDPDGLMLISENGMLLIGKKSDRGKYPPDW